MQAKGRQGEGMLNSWARSERKAGRGDTGELGQKCRIWTASPKHYRCPHGRMSPGSSGFGGLLEELGAYPTHETLGVLKNNHNQYGRRRLSTTFVHTVARIHPSKKIEKDVRILQMQDPISKREFHFKTRIPSKNEKPKPRVGESRRSRPSQGRLT